MTSALDSVITSKNPKSFIFNPFEINEEEYISEYQNELDQDRNYFNRFSYCLSGSSHPTK